MLLELLKASGVSTDSSQEIPDAVKDLLELLAGSSDEIDLLEMWMSDADRN